MPVKRLTKKGETDRYLAKRLELINRAIAYNLCFVAEQVLNAARSTQSYKDQTGNLRSSTGYVVVQDGRIIQESSFEVVKDGKDGTVNGKEFAEQLVREFPTGYALIVVAGMNYASYVTDKGYDVLDSAELLARKLVPQMLKRLKLK
jgi:hypothetical protein